MQRILVLTCGLVCALGLENQLIGRSHECDYPLSVSRLPICTAPKFSTEGTSREIDQRVKGLLQQALSIYRVDADLLKQLRPTHIFTQTQCEVCAVSLKEVEQALRDWIVPVSAAETSPILIPLAPNSLSDIWGDIQRVADAKGRHSGAKPLQKFSFNRFLHQQSGARAAHLPLVQPDRIYQPFDRRIDVGVLKDDIRGFSAKFE